MEKNILLINPWIHDFAAYDFWIKPLGLLYIASFLRMNGYKVNFIDCLDPENPHMKKDSSRPPLRRYSSGHGKYFKEIIPRPQPLEYVPKNYHRYGITPQIFRGMLISLPKPDMILISSMMTYWYPGVFEAIGVLKDVFPAVPVVLGGNYVSLCPEHAASRSGADFLLPGVGEGNIAALLNRVWGDNLPVIPDVHNLDSYPYPAYDLISNPGQVPIRTSRGCPFDCTYCASGILNPIFCRRDPEKVFAEIIFWYNHLGIRNFSLYDDAFLINPEEMAVPLLKEIIRCRLSCQFHCPNGLHLREVTDELAMLMFNAGFKTIRFGFETSDVKRQNETGGKVTNQEFRNAVRSLKNAGYQAHDIGIYILCGMPSQRAEEVRESVIFVKSCQARPILAEYSPIPRTALWHAAVLASPFNITEEPLYQNNTLLPCRSEYFSYDMYRSLKALTRN